MLMEDIEVKVYRSAIKLPVAFFVPATFLVTVYVLLYLLVNSQLFIDEALGRLNAALPGQFALEELVVDPTFTEVHIWNATIDGRDGKRIITASEVHAGVNPLPLLVRRIQVDHALAKRSAFDMEFYDNGRMNLLDALGIEDLPEGDDGAEPLINSVSLGNLKTEDCRYSLDVGFFRFVVPDADVPHGEVDIAEETLVMQVPELDVDRVDFEFEPWLFYFPKEKGRWRFSAEDIQIRNWAWAGDGFSVEKVATHVGGVEAAATGTMYFPPGEPHEDTKMVYRGRGTFSLPPYTRTGQYFIEDLFHIDSPYIEIAVEGTLQAIGGEAQFELGVLDAYGVQATDIAGTAVLNDEIVYVDEARGRLHGGDVSMKGMYFDMYTGQFGGDAVFEGVNPAGVVRDIGYDYPWLEGRVEGAMSVLGQIPFDEEYGPDTSPFVMLDQFLSPTVEVRFPTDVVFERTGALDTLPGRRFRMRSGSWLWATEERVGIEDTTIVADHAVFDIDDFVFDWELYEVLRNQYGDIAHIEVRADSIEKLLGDYGGSGFDGRLTAKLDAVGRFNYPDVDFDVRIEKPRVTAGGLDVPGDALATKGSLRDGRVRLSRTDLRSPSGSATVAGWVEVLRDPRGLVDEEGEIITDYLYPSRHAAELDIGVEDFDLEIAKKLADVDLDVTGKADGRLELSRSLENPDASFSVTGSGVNLMGQPLETVQFAGEIEDRTYRVHDAVIDAGPAGRVTGWANVGFDESLAFEIDGAGIALQKLVPIQTRGMTVAGVGDFHFHGRGTTSAPKIGGDMRIEDLAVENRELGDLALVANTIGDTTHLAGALLPWVTVDIEVPLDGESSYYARFGIDHLDIADAVPELRRIRVINEAEATGIVEVFLEHDFSRYQVLANLSEVRLDSLGKTFQNRGPIIAGLNDGNLFQIQQATIGADNRWVSIQGGIFLDEALIDLQMRGDLDLSLLTGFRLSFPDFFPESFLESTGLIAMDVAVKGTPGLVVADGFVDFRPSEFLLRDVNEPLTILSGRVDFDRAGIHVGSENPIRGRILGGVFSGTGKLGLDGMKPANLEAEVWTHNFSYRIPSVANFTFDTRLDVTAPDLDRPDTWRVSGDLDILDGLYYENVSIFQEQLTNRIIGAFSRKTERYEASIIEQFPALEEMSFDVAIRARDGFRIQNEIDRLELDLEFRIDLRLQNTLPDPRVTGDIDVIGGRVTFQGEAFEVRTGTLSFYGNPDNPYIDVVAEADVFNTCRDTDVTAEVSQTMSLSGVVDTGEQKSYRVLLNARGPLDNLDIQFESNPYADQRDILSLLLTGCTVDQLTASSASSPTLEVALGPVLGWIEGQVQDVVDVEEFTITPSVDRLKATVGDSISRRLSWKLQLDTGLTEVATGQRFQLEYKLSDRWSAQASESSTESSQFDSFLVDFKLKYRILLD